MTEIEKFIGKKNSEILRDNGVDIINAYFKDSFHLNGTIVIKENDSPDALSCCFDIDCYKKDFTATIAKIYENFDVTNTNYEAEFAEKIKNTLETVSNALWKETLLTFLPEEKLLTERERHANEALFDEKLEIELFARQSPETNEYELNVQLALEGHEYQAENVYVCCGNGKSFTEGLREASDSFDTAEYIRDEIAFYEERYGKLIEKDENSIKGYAYDIKSTLEHYTQYFEKFTKSVEIKFPKEMIEQLVRMGLLDEANANNDSKIIEALSKGLSDFEKIQNLSVDIPKEGNIDFKEYVYNKIIDVIGNGCDFLQLSPSPDSHKGIDESELLSCFRDYQEYIKSNETKTTFKDYLTNFIYEDYAWKREEMAERLFQDVEQIIPQRLQPAWEMLNEDKTHYEVLKACGFKGFSINTDDFLNNDYKLNLILGTTTEKRFDCSFIKSAFPKDLNKLNQIVDGFNVYNALTYLVYQQGEQMSELYDMYYNNGNQSNAFLKSVVNELKFDFIGCAKNLDLVALVSAKGENLINLLEEVANRSPVSGIILSEDTTIGLVDFNEGDCSLMGIRLQKPAIVSGEMIKDIQIEFAIGNKGISIGEAFCCETLRDEDWTKGDVQITDVVPDVDAESSYDLEQQLKKYANKQKSNLERD